MHRKHAQPINTCTPASCSSSTIPSRHHHKKNAPSAGCSSDRQQQQQQQQKEAKKNNKQRTWHRFFIAPQKHANVTNLCTYSTEGISLSSRVLASLRDLGPSRCGKTYLPARPAINEHPGELFTKVHLGSVAHATGCTKKKKRDERGGSGHGEGKGLFSECVLLEQSCRERSHFMDPPLLCTTKPRQHTKIVTGKLLMP